MKPLNECHVLVSATSYGRTNPALRTELENQVGKVSYNTTGKPLSSAQLAEMLPMVDGYIAGLDEIDAAALETAVNLRVIARYGVGISNVDLAAAKSKEIVVTNTPGANSKSVAELTIGLMLNLLRPMGEAATQTRTGAWPRTKGISLDGKTVGLVGLGAIGKEVAKRLSGFDCHILAYDVAVDQEFAAQFGVVPVALPKLLEAADIVSLHVPVLPATHGFVNNEFLSQMKPESYLINTSRGELINEADLLNALQEGKLKGAALDAFSQEPPDKDNPLLKLPQLIPTPHMGAHTDGATNAMGQMALAECLAVLQGEQPKYRVV